MASQANPALSAKAAADDLSARAQAFITETWDRLKNAYVIYHMASWEAFLFYAGESRIEADSAKRQFQPERIEEEWTPRPRINRFSPAIDAISANFGQVPEIEAIPSQPENDIAIAVADICTRLVQHFLKDLGLRDEIRDGDDLVGTAAMLFSLAGCVFTEVAIEEEVVATLPKPSMVPAVNAMCPTCDTMETLPQPAGAPAVGNCPQCGQPYQTSPTTMMGAAEDENGEPAMMEVTQPRVSLEIGNSIHAFPRAGAKSMGDTDYLLWAERWSLDRVWRELKFEAEPDNIWPDGYSVTLQHALAYFYLGYAIESNEARDSCMVLRMFVEPNRTKDFPDGFYGVVVNQQLVKFQTWKEAFEEHPLTKFDYLRIPTLFFPRSTAFDLAPIQRELNRYESIIALHAMVSAVSPWICDENSTVSEITGRSDKIIYFKSLGPGALPPHREPAGALDEGIYTQRNSLHEEFSNISMAVNVFRGKQEGGVTAASAIQRLQSQAETMFSKPVRNWSGGWKETLRKAVKTAQARYSLPQLIDILGADRLPQIKFFQQADLDDLVEFTATTSGLPRTRDERKAEMIQMWDKGALDINDSHVKQKIFELFGETGMMTTFNLDATRARLENALMKQGVPAQVMEPPLQDPAVHLGIHVDQFKNLDFDLWPQPSKQLLIEHIQATQQLVEQMASATQPPPGPPKPGAKGLPPKPAGGFPAAAPLPAPAPIPGAPVPAAPAA